MGGGGGELNISVHGLIVRTRFYFTRCVDSESVITIMYIYHALINALSAHMIHIISLINMIFYTHVEHSPTETVYINYCNYLYCIGTNEEYPWWSLCTSYLHACQARVTSDDVPLVEFMYLVFARMPGESYRKRPRSLLLYLCDIF